MILKSFLVFAPAWLAGIGLAHAFWHSREPWSIPLKIFLGLGLGMGITSCLYFLRLAGLPGQSGYLLIQAMFLFVVLIVLLLQNRVSWPALPRSMHFTRSQILLSLAAVVVLVFTLQYSLVFARFSPHGDYDAQAIWNLRARFMFRLGEDWENAFSPFINRNFHMDYPLLVPTNVAGGWNALGEEAVRLPAVQSTLFLLGLAGLLYAATGYLRSGSQAALAVTVVLATPYLVRFSGFQAADIPFAYFALGAGILFLLARREGSAGLLFLCGLMAGLSAWTKNEGVSFALILFIVTLAAFFHQQRWISLFSFVGGLGLPLLTILLFKIMFPARNDLLSDSSLLSIFQKLLDPARYGLLLTYLKSELAILGGWPVSIVILLAVYGLIMGAGPAVHPRADRWLLVIVAAQFLAYILVYLVTPNDLEWQLRYSLDRLLIHLFPLGLLLFFLFIRTPEQVFETDLPASQEHS